MRPGDILSTCFAISEVQFEKNIFTATVRQKPNLLVFVLELLLPLGLDPF